MCFLSSDYMPGGPPQTPIVISFCNHVWWTMCVVGWWALCAFHVRTPDPVSLEGVQCLYPWEQSPTSAVILREQLLSPTSCLQTEHAYFITTTAGPGATRTHEEPSRQNTRGHLGATFSLYYTRHGELLSLWFMPVYRWVNMSHMHSVQGAFWSSSCSHAGWCCPARHLPIPVPFLRTEPAFPFYMPVIPWSDLCFVSLELFCLVLEVNYVWWRQCVDCSSLYSVVRRRCVLHWRRQ